jgi:hypothetical protein
VTTYVANRCFTKSLRFGRGGKQNLKVTAHKFTALQAANEAAGGEACNNVIFQLI